MEVRCNGVSTLPRTNYLDKKRWCTVNLHNIWLLFEKDAKSSGQVHDGHSNQLVHIIFIVQNYIS